MNPSAADLLFSATCALYAGAVAGYLAALASERPLAGRLASGLALVGLVAHTALLGVHWYQAASAEVAGSGSSFVAALLTHPPLTSLFESLLSAAWCVVAVALAVELKWKLRPVSLLALGVALAALAEAYLVLEKSAHPLVPALQSWWLATHVAVLFVAYALFLAAAALALMSLLKDRALPAMRLGFAGVTCVVLLATGLRHGLGHLAFRLTPLVQVGGAWQPAIFLGPGSSRPVRFEVDVPLLGVQLAVAIAFFVAAGLAYAIEMKAGRDAGRKSRGLLLMGIGLLALFACFLRLGVALATQEVKLPADAVAAGLTGPAKLSVQGNFAVGPLVLGLLIAGSFVAIAVWQGPILARLPERARLDDMTYRLVLLAFPLLGFGIVMGAFWAFDAWGSYWSWDPKETWSLVTFLFYALYLHTRRTLGWTGRRTAILAIAGFALVVFTYLGVNLGLTGEGLHTYGNG